MVAEVRFSSHTELAKERAKRIIDGTYTVWKIAHGKEGFALDMTVSKCALCEGSFPPIGWAMSFHDEDGHFLAVHPGCHKEANNWAGLESEQDDE